jgi:ribulose kinase
VCKCSYIPAGVNPAVRGWDADFFRAIGLDQVVEGGHKQLGGAPGQNDSLVLTAGMPVGRGLSKKAAEKLGLVEGTPVGSGVIDA